MSKLRFDLVSPERLLVSAEVDQVDVPGSEGDFGVFANHAPVMTSLRPGVLTVLSQGKQGDKFFVRGGFAEVTAQGLTVLAEEAMPLADLPCSLRKQCPWQTLIGQPSISASGMRKKMWLMQETPRHAIALSRR